ncbi:carboxypeptidase-like protein [Apiospora phragmitis]|uniref:Carboxypeptidase n=1 Tax=Apiospora phragmitis TaxID=2905665 RepID=A0ABR1URW2_9PEZI
MKLSLLAFALPLAAVAGASHQPMHLTRQAEYKKRMDARMEAMKLETTPYDITKRQLSSQFLNDNSTKFAVDGSKLPNITFDIGESYAGSLPIGSSNASELFFWFFPSADASVKKEIVIWFTGGPGCSSMNGLFSENGPVTWMAGTFAPQLNPWSWHRLSNVVWVDQPVGTGYSTGMPTANNETDVADQFRGFWRNFVDVFKMQGYAVYITGESYAGAYCPYIASGMLDQNDKEYFNVSGMLIYDGVYTEDSVAENVPAVPFTDSLPGLFPFNETFSKDIHDRHQSCGYADYLEKYLVYPASGPQPQPGAMNGNVTVEKKGCASILNDIDDAITAINPCFNIYQVTNGCPFLYDPTGGVYDYVPNGAPIIYFNQTAVKEALHAPLNKNWQLCTDTNVFPKGDNSLPSNQLAIPNVIQHTNNVMLVHGALDMVLIANGTMLAVQNMTWGGKRGFDSKPELPLYVPYHSPGDKGTTAGAGVLGTAHTERGLTVALVAFSGHMVPANQPSVAFRQLEVLLGRVPNLQSLVPFTTDANATQHPAADSLGAGTGPQVWLGGNSNASSTCNGGSGGSGGNAKGTTTSAAVGSWTGAGSACLGASILFVMMCGWVL